MTRRCLLVATLVVASCRAVQPAPETLERGMVVCEHPLAAEVGAHVLDLGGNAADAAVATALALAVVYPQAGNLGGGGFALWSARDGTALALDFRETAPLSASAARYFDARGAVLGELLLSSPLAVGVPGSPAGLEALLERCGSGRFTLLDLAGPAIALAEQGFSVDADLADDLRSEEERARLERSPAARALFYPHGEALAVGERLVQRELADTLRRYAASGAPGFYEGATRAALLAELERAARSLPQGEPWDAGWIAAPDLDQYRVRWREPLRAVFRGREVLVMPLPSSGGIILLQTLATLETFPLDLRRAEALQSKSGDTLASGLDATAIHWWIEVLRHAFQARAEWMGDPDFYPVPLNAMLSAGWVRGCRESVGERCSVLAIGRNLREGSNTTHLSVVDAQGNAVSLTTTLNSTFGSGMLVAGAGFLLNNELDDFSLGAEVPNQFGLVGGRANVIQPGKRPLSSMSPTIVRRDGRVELVLGSPGGPRIITAVIGVLLRVVVYGETLEQAVLAPRFHQQWSPPETRFEPGWPPAVLANLRARGHPIEQLTTRWASVQAIGVDAAGRVVGVSDPRRGGAARSSTVGADVARD